MHGLIFQEDHPFKMFPNFRKSLIDSVGLHLHSGRLYLITRDGNGWRGSGRPRVPRGLQELAALFISIAERTLLFWYCSAGDVFQIIACLMLLPYRLKQKERLRRVFWQYLVLRRAEGCMGLCCCFLHQQNREL